MNLFRKLLKKVLSGSRNGAKKQTGAGANPPLDTKLAANLRSMKSQIGGSADFIIRKFTMGDAKPREAAVVYVEGLADQKAVLEPLVMLLHEQASRDLEWHRATAEDLLRRMFLPVSEVRTERDQSAVMLAILSGEIAILLDGLDFAIVANARKWKERGIEEPQAEPGVRGPREGFTETLRTNTALLRRKIRDPNFWMETVRIGRVTQTDVAIMYVRGIADPQVVADVRNRLTSIDADSILDSGYIEEYIQDRTLTVFPTIYSSERPDVVAGEVLDGRVAILVDGSPFVLVAPATFTQFMQASEDYYQRWLFSSLTRGIRYISLLISLLAPAMYIAVTTFHQEVLPTQLLFSIAAAREDVPFPAFFEALGMELTFEILREAGLRMPKTIGQAVSIVGTLVIGQAAVEADFVSPAMVIIVALTAISNFVIPAYSMAIAFRILRFFMMFLAGVAGIFGITVGLFIVVFHLSSLRSFGLPFLTSLAPFRITDQKDVILRLPRWALFSRPSFTRNTNFIRIGTEEEKKKR